MEAENVRVLDPFSVFLKALDRRSLVLLVLLFLSATAEVVVGRIVGFFPSKLYSAITTNDAETFSARAFQYSRWSAFIAILISVKLWFADKLAVLLRSNLDIALHNAYMRGNTLYNMRSGISEIDNPDSRITQDVTHWAGFACTILAQIIQTPVIVIYYGYLTQKDLGIFSLVVCCFFAVLSMAAPRLSMKRVVSNTYQFETAQASYRLAHTNIKENAEIICLSGGEQYEKAELRRKLELSLHAQRTLANSSFPLNLLTNSLCYFSVCLVFVMIYGLSWDKVENAEHTNDIVEYISRSGFVSLSMIGGISMLISIAQDFSKLCGYSTRILELWNAVFSEQKPIPSKENKKQVVMKNVDITAPGNKKILSNLSFTINKGDSIYITGPSGVGKTSIFRVLSKLWPVSAGEIELPPYGRNSFLILTQNPYIPTSGSFDDALAFPLKASAVEQEELLRAVEELNLTKVRDRVREMGDWSAGLSSGERQRVALARVLIHKPEFVLLDEATSANEASLEVKFFNKISAMGMTVLTISHNQTLRQHHKYSLDIDESGEYKISTNF